MDNQLVEYIQGQLSQGVPKEKIANDLLANKWEQRVIDEAFASIESGSMAPAPAEVSPVTGNVVANQLPHASPAGPQQSGPAPQEYKVFQAISDSISALKTNMRSVLLLIGLNFLLFLGISVLTTFLIALTVRSSINNVATFNPLSLLVSLIPGVVLYILLASFSLAAFSLAIYDGAEGKKSSLKTIVDQAKSLFIRLIGANILFTVVLFGPLMGTAILTFVLAFLAGDSLGAVGILYLLASLASAIWIIIGIFRFMLIPMVAIFEPKVPLLQTPSRSKALLTQGGQWFLVKGFGLLILAAIIVGVLTGGSDNIFASILQIVVSLIYEAVLVMLYKNRKAVKG